MVGMMRVWWGDAGAMPADAPPTFSPGGTAAFLGGFAEDILPSVERLRARRRAGWCVAVVSARVAPGVSAGYGGDSASAGGGAPGLRVASTPKGSADGGASGRSGAKLDLGTSSGVAGGPAGGTAGGSAGGTAGCERVWRCIPRSTRRDSLGAPSWKRPATSSRPRLRRGGGVSGGAVCEAVRGGAVCEAGRWWIWRW